MGVLRVTTRARTRSVAATFTSRNRFFSRSPRTNSLGGLSVVVDLRWLLRESLDLGRLRDSESDPELRLIGVRLAMCGSTLR